MTGIAIPILLCGLFIWYTGNKYKDLTGTWQYAPFSGWQMANNAMYTYRYVDSAERKPVPKKFKALDNMIRSYFDSTRDVRRFPAEEIKASTAYMWTRYMPLYQYREKILPKDSTTSELKKWASMGPIYKAYGIYILRQYPREYAQHFLWPNFIKYYAPPVEFLEFYNGKNDTVTALTKAWFRYSSQKVYSKIKDPKAYPLDIYPVLTGTMNVVLFCCLVCFCMLHGFQQKNTLPKTMIIVITIWLLNAVFTIVSSPAAVRLQAFPILLETCFALVLVDWLWKLAVNADLANSLKPGFDNKPTALQTKVMTQ